MIFSKLLSALLSSTISLIFCFNSFAHAHTDSEIMLVMQLMMPTSLQPKDHMRAGNYIQANNIFALPAAAAGFLRNNIELPTDPFSLALTNGDPHALINACDELPLTATAHKLNIFASLSAQNVGLVHDGSIGLHNGIDAEKVFIRTLMGGIEIESAHDNRQLIHRTKLLASVCLALISAEDCHLVGIQTQSGIKTIIHAMGLILQEPVKTISERVESFRSKKRSETHRITEIRHVPVDHKSGGEIEVSSNSNHVDYGSTYNAPKVHTHGEDGNYHLPVVNQTLTQSEVTTKSGGVCSTSKTIQSQSFISDTQGGSVSGDKFTATSSGTVIMHDEALNSKETDVTAKHAEFLTGSTSTSSASSSSYHGRIWDKQTQTAENHTHYKEYPLNTDLSVNAGSVLFQNLPEGISITFNPEASVEYDHLIDSSTYQEKTQRQLAAPARMAIQAIISAALSFTGPGAALASAFNLAEGGVACIAVTAAGNSLASSVCNQFAVNSIEQGIGKGFKVTFKPKNMAKMLGNAALAAATQTASADLHAYCGLNGEKLAFFDKIQKELISTTVATVLETSFKGGSLGENYLTNLKAAGIDLLAAEAAGGIGRLKYKHGLDPFTHKVLHFIAVGFMAELSGSDFVSGGLGAAVAETIAELYLDAANRNRIDDDQSFLDEQFDALLTAEKTADRRLTADEVNQIGKQAVEKCMQDRGSRAALAGKFAAIGAAFVLEKDVQAAYDAGVNAVENNCLPGIAVAYAPEIIAGGRVVGSLLYNMYRSYNAISAVGECLENAQAKNQQANVTSEDELLISSLTAINDAQAKSNPAFNIVYNKVKAENKVQRAQRENCGNAANNNNDDDDDGDPDDKPKKAKSPNQLNQEINRGKAPKGIKRVDVQTQQKGEQTHVHFDDDSALNMDGTWRHGFRKLTKDQMQWLRQNGWKI